MRCQVPKCATVCWPSHARHGTDICIVYMQQHFCTARQQRPADWNLLCRLFEMPIALALTAGFIQSAISPTVLVTGMLELQRRGYGQAKGQPRQHRMCKLVCMLHWSLWSCNCDLALNTACCGFISGMSGTA